MKLMNSIISAPNYPEIENYLKAVDDTINGSRVLTIMYCVPLMLVYLTMVPLALPLYLYRKG